MNTHTKRSRKDRYTIRVTEVNHAETVDHTGLPTDNVWAKQGHFYNILVKGVRLDFTNVPITALVLAGVGNSLSLPQKGDFVMVEHTDDHYLPIVVGTMSSMYFQHDGEDVPSSQPHKHVWSEAVKNFARPLSPVLESYGNRGEVHSYNQQYVTYYEDYEPTDEDFGTWYDRFVLFNNSETYKDKKPFIRYNEDWIKSNLEAKGEGVSNLLLRLVEDHTDYYRPERYFFLGDGRFAYRPDPVFDKNSNYHQSVKTDFVVRDGDGGATMFDVADTDMYPFPLTLQTPADEKLDYTAYDDVINDILSEARKAAKNTSNADLPYEPKMEKQIRMGRNRFVMADMHGDGKQIMVTLKTHRDQQFTLIYNEGDESQTSQVRLRGAFGESVLLESSGTSKDDVFSRFQVKGVEGQIVEMYDDAASKENYIYMVSSDRDSLGEGYPFGAASYVLLTNKKYPDFMRLGNNGGLVNKGRSVLSGIFENGYTAHRHLYWDEDTSILYEHRNLVQGAMVFDSLIEVSPVNVTRNVKYDAAGSFVKESYDAVLRYYKVENSTETFLEFDDDKINIEAPLNIFVDAGNNLTINTGNDLVMSAGNNIDIDAANSMTVDAVTSMKLTVGSSYLDLQPTSATIEGSAINLGAGASEKAHKGTITTSSVDGTGLHTHTVAANSTKVNIE